MCNSRTREHSKHLDDNFFCPFPIFITAIFAFYFLGVSLNMHSYCRFDIIKNLENLIFWYIGIIILAGILALLVTYLFILVVMLFSENKKIFGIILSIFPVATLLLIVYLGKKTYYGFYIAIAFVIIEIIFLFVLTTIALIYLITHRKVKSSHRFEEELMAFDRVQVDSNNNHLKNDLDIVGEGTEIIEIVKKEIESGLIIF
jgi:hypothetical protein